jgi:hypothetical protein
MADTGRIQPDNSKKRGSTNEGARRSAPTWLITARNAQAHQDRGSLGTSGGAQRSTVIDRAALRPSRWVSVHPLVCLLTHYVPPAFSPADNSKKRVTAKKKTQTRQRTAG